MPNQKFNVGEECERPLYPGSQVSIFMTYLLVFQFSIRHSLTESALKGLLLLISVLLPSFPKSVRKLKRFFSKAFPKLMPSFQEYCIVHATNCLSKAWVALNVRCNKKCQVHGCAHWIWNWIKVAGLVHSWCTTGPIMRVEILSSELSYRYELQCLRVYNSFL